jgi:hypothetical protein
VTVTAPTAGTYQIEVFGYTDTVFRLQFGSTTSAAESSLSDRVSQSPRRAQAKTARSQAATSASDEPAGFAAVEAAPVDAEIGTATPGPGTPTVASTATTMTPTAIATATPTGARIMLPAALKNIGQGW